ncbi:MAG: YeeE/YedE family protein [Pseudomonadota bacterium]
MDVTGGGFAAALVGLVGGMLLGLAARRGRFCTLGAIEDSIYGRDLNRIRMWALALAVSIGGVHASAFAGLIDISGTLYARVPWNPVSSVLGGLMFGYGMAMAGNCGYGALARLGGGDLRSLVIVIVTGIAAYATLYGPLSGVRTAAFPPDPYAAIDMTTLPDLIAPLADVPPVMIALAVASLLAGWALSARAFRNSTSHVLWATIAGTAIATGWVGTALVSAISFDIVPVESHTFTAPLGESIFALMVGDGQDFSFGIGSVLGVIVGAAIGSISRGHFRWEACDDPGELGRQIVGGALMGIGGVLAMGCSIGQGMTAFSVLATSAPVVLCAVFVGALVGLRHLIQGFEATG